MASSAPAGVEPKMVNAKRFELEYDLESVGEAGITNVELWGTRDGGKTWSKMGVDDDSRSPIVATVDGEGLYGFTIVVESATGLKGATPRSGDTPEVWVGVDLTKPAANIVGVEQVQSATGEMTIRWEASDAQLAARPITLAFAEQAGGPWQPIASGLENTGRYTWRLDHRVPDSVFIRIEVRDQAGNTATAVTTEPVTLDRVRPKGRIRDVRPTTSSARGPKRIINR
jgi:hypothetical protein